MLCRKFEWIPIKIGFSTNFQSCSKIGPKTLYRVFGFLGLTFNTSIPFHSWDVSLIPLENDFLLKNKPFSENYHGYSPCFFPKIGSEITPD